MPKHAVQGNATRIVRSKDDPTISDLENERLADAAEAHEARLRFERGEMSPKEAEGYVKAGGRGTGS